MKKTILVTGASAGLGAHTALILAAHGHRVWASMRNLDKQGGLLAAKQAAGLDLEVVQLDVQDSASVQACVDHIIATDGKLDVLVNNAGAGYLRSTEQASEEDVRWVMDVNFHGVVRCTKAVLPHMRAAKSGHIVNISSIGGLVGQPFNEIYCAAKFAVEGYTESMASYMEAGFGIKFSIIEPGGIQSDFAKSVMAKMEADGGLLQDAYLPLLQKYIGNIRSRSPEDIAQIYQTPEQCAEMVVACIESPEPPIRMRTSHWSEQFCTLKTQADPDGRLLQQQVMRQLLGLKKKHY